MDLETRRLPEFIIGSMVNVCPAFITPTALFPDQVKALWESEVIGIVQRDGMIHIHRSSIRFVKIYHEFIYFTRGYWHNGEYLVHSGRARQFHDHNKILPVARDKIA